VAARQEAAEAQRRALEHSQAAAAAQVLAATRSALWLEAVSKGRQQPVQRQGSRSRNSGAPLASVRSAAPAGPEPFMSPPVVAGTLPGAIYDPSPPAAPFSPPRPNAARAAPPAVGAAAGALGGAKPPPPQRLQLSIPPPRSRSPLTITEQQALLSPARRGPRNLTSLQQRSQPAQPSDSLSRPSCFRTPSRRELWLGQGGRKRSARAHRAAPVSGKPDALAAVLVAPAEASVKVPPPLVLPPAEYPAGDADPEAPAPHSTLATARQVLHPAPVPQQQQQQQQQLSMAQQQRVQRQAVSIGTGPQRHLQCPRLAFGLSSRRSSRSRPAITGASGRLCWRTRNPRQPNGSGPPPGVHKEESSLMLVQGGSPYRRDGTTVPTMQCWEARLRG